MAVSGLNVLTERVNTLHPTANSLTFTIYSIVHNSQVVRKISNH